MDPQALTDVVDQLADTLKAIANRNRLLLVCQLTEQERSVGELASLVGMRLPAASQHLARLRSAGLIEGRRDGRTVYYSIARDDIRRLMAFLYDTYCPESIGGGP